MSRRRKFAAPAAGPRFAPLLAVLISTMGALVVLLCAFARHGQCLASQTDQMKQADIEQEHREVEWRIQQLLEARSKTEAQLADRRLELSHVEDHERRLRQDLDRVATSVQQMRQITASGSSQRQETAAELDRIRGDIKKAEAEVGEAEHDAKNKGVCYSVVPYQGPNQTRRRPIYIECAADSVILQPEEIVLKESDFEGPLGPGNPLAAALRAVREQMAARGNGGPPEEPYPLLFVRPEGIGAYYAARAALVSWGSEFGYELVGADWKLQFPESDPQLRQIIRTVVSEARLRQQELVEAAPHQYGRERPKYRVSQNGGFVREGGGGDGDDESSGAFGVGKRSDRSVAGGDGSRGSRSAGDGTTGGAGGGTAHGRYQLAGNSDSGSKTGSGSGDGDSSNNGSAVGPSGVNPYAAAIAQVGGRGAAPAGTFGLGGNGLPGSAGAGGGSPNGAAGGTPGGTGSGNGLPSAFAGGGAAGQMGAGNGLPGAGGGAGGTGNGFGTGGAAGGMLGTQPGGGYPAGTANGFPSGGGSGLAGGTANAQPNGAGGIGGAGSASAIGGGSTAANIGPQTGPYAVGGGQAGAPPGGTSPAGSLQGGSPPGGSPNGAFATGGSPPGGTSSGGASVGGAAPGGSPGGTAASGSPGGSSSSATFGSSSDSGGGGGGGGGPPPPPGDPSAPPSGVAMPSLTINANDPEKKKPDSMAKKRGRDWGLADSTNKKIGVTRPVMIVCAPNQLVILPEQGSGGGKVIPLGPNVQDSMDALVAGVGDHIKTWGIAGKGLYWKPTLVVDVQPGAARQYADMKALLADSGMEVKERQRPAPVAGVPPGAIRR